MMSSLLKVSLKVPISYQAGEELAIGLIILHDGRAELRVSDFKLSIAKKLITPESYTLLTEKLRMIEKEFVSLSRSEEIDFDSSHSLLTENYLMYLSRYSNNTLRFDVDQLELEYSDDVFDLLFARYVTEVSDKQRVKKEINIKTWVKNQLKSKIENRVSWDVVLDSQHLPKLIFPEIRFDFAGMNGKLVVGQALDFSKEYKLVRNELASIYAFSQNKSGVNKTYVIGLEPQKSAELNHALWQQFREVPTITMVNGKSELEQIPDYLDKEEVRPYSLS